MGKFKHKILRDLHWVFESPGLMDPNTGKFSGIAVCDTTSKALVNANMTFLHALDLDPQPLQEWLAQRSSRRVGRYFENLIEFGLRYFEGVTLKASHESVRNALNVTLGEFDFLFINEQTDSPHHWESAVKFFLCGTYTKKWEHFRGPNVRDSLALKLNKVLNHQTKLGSLPESADLLTSLFGERSFPEGQAFLKGYFFYPAHLNWQSDGSLSPDGASENHNRGWWTRAGSLDIPCSAPGSRYVILERLSWLSDFYFDPNFDDASPNIEFLDRQILTTLLTSHFHQGIDPMLICEVIFKEDRLVWTEVSRGFVVHSNWCTSFTAPSLNL